MISVAGHFGEILQGRLGPSGPVALVTLPCPTLCARIETTPGPFRLIGSAVLTVAQAASLGITLTGQHRLTLDMPPGGGAGASTAARVALLRAHGMRDAEQIAAACLASEGASDPLMFPAPGRLLWASREGRILARLPRWPALEIIGGFLGAGQQTDPRDSHFPDIADLAAALPEACRSAQAFAQIASASARRSLALRGPVSDPTEALATRLGALGFAIAHTGSARALLYAPGTVPANAPAILRRAGFCLITRYLLEDN